MWFWLVFTWVFLLVVFDDDLLIVLMLAAFCGLVMWFGMICYFGWRCGVWLFWFDCEICCLRLLG